MSLPTLYYSSLFLLFLNSPALPASTGIKNFHQVDAQVYRGGQPTEEGFRHLASIGVKTVIDLREADARSDAEEKLVTSIGMRYVSVPMTGLKPPSEEEISKILNILENTGAGPVFVHCMRGADRTGAVIASYRIEHDRWDNARALHEANALGMSFFQFPRQSYIRNFQPRIIDAKAVGPKPSAPSPAPDAGFSADHAIARRAINSPS
jgi:protein tyrosine phosphatase (PTP) superfamily phosphohydrolase (DUF442 family)